MTDLPAPNSSKKPLLLVVEEEEGILRLLQLALGRHGFDVLAAANGKDALQIYRDQGAAIKLVLMDVRMRNLTGPETLVKLREMNAGVRCCFMTGDSSINISDKLLALGALRVFHKPFPSLTDLADTLRELAKD